VRLCLGFLAKYFWIELSHHLQPLVVLREVEIEKKKLVQCITEIKTLRILRNFQKTQRPKNRQAKIPNQSIKRREKRRERDKEMMQLQFKQFKEQVTEI